MSNSTIVDAINLTAEFRSKFKVAAGKSPDDGAKEAIRFTSALVQLGVPIHAAFDTACTVAGVSSQITTAPSIQTDKEPDYRAPHDTWLMYEIAAAQKAIIIAKDTLALNKG